MNIWLWFAQVGSLRYTVGRGCWFGWNLERNRAPRWTAPVPEMVWKDATFLLSVRIFCDRRRMGEGYSVVFDRRAVSTQNQFLSCAGILRQARDGEVFMVELWVIFENVICLFLS